MVGRGKTNCFISALTDFSSHNGCVCIHPGVYPASDGIGFHQNHIFYVKVILINRLSMSPPLSYLMAHHKSPTPTVKNYYSTKQSPPDTNSNQSFIGLISAVTTTLIADSPGLCRQV